MSSDGQQLSGTWRTSLTTAGNPLFVGGRPLMELQRAAVDTNGRPAAAAGARRGERRNRPIVVGRDLTGILRHELRNGGGKFVDDRCRVEADDFQRSPHPLEMFREAEDLAAKGSQPLGDRRAQEETDVVDRDREFLCRNPVAVRVGQ